MNPNFQGLGVGDLPHFQELEFFQGTVEGVTGIQRYHINYNHPYQHIIYNRFYHQINYNHLCQYINCTQHYHINYNHPYQHIMYNRFYHQINYKQLCQYINYTQHYHITDFMLDRSIATMARVKEGTMGQGGVQTSEEDNVKTFTIQLVYQKERGKEVTGNEGEGKKDGDKEKKDKDTKNGIEPIDTPNTVDICAEVHKELCKSVTNSGEKLLSADRKDLVGESSQPCSWKENQRVICYITSKSEEGQDTESQGTPTGLTPDSAGGTESGIS